MKFNYVGFKNFNSYGDYNTKLSLDDKNIKFLIGDNGSGKSSVISAILFAIYGFTPANIDEIINRTTMKNCQVRFSFNIGEDEYLIIRFRRDEKYKNSLFLLKNGESITLRKIPDTQDKILEIINIPYQTMINSILFSSELYTSFLRSTVTKRLNILENLLSIKELEKYQKIIYDLKRPIIEELSSLNDSKIKLSTEVNVLSKSLREYRQRTKNKLKEISDRIDDKKREKDEIINKMNIKIDISEEIEKNRIYIEKRKNNEYIDELITNEKRKLQSCDHLLLEKKDLKNKEQADTCPVCKQEIKNLKITKQILKQKDELINKRIKELEENNNNIDKAISILVNKKVKLIKSKFSNDELQKMKLIKDEHDKLISNIDNNILILKERALEVYDKKYVVETEKRIKRIKNVLSKIDNNIYETTMNKEHHEIMGELFSNNKDSIKKLIIEDRIGFFNTKINFYLPIFFEKDIKIEFDKNLSETIYVNNTETSFGTFSSGEKMRIELSVAFSLFSLVRMFFHVPINLLVFDELLDQNLDKLGIEKVLQIINNFSKNSSILIISHNDSYKEAYTNKVGVYKDKDGFSRLIREE